MFTSSMRTRILANYERVPRCIYRAAQIEATVDKDTRDTGEAARIADHGLVVEPSADE
jgi:hypothetical protein